MSKPTKHWSDCAVHSEPAYPAGECDCGGYDADKELLESSKAFYNATIAAKNVRIVATSAEQRDHISNLGFRLRLAIQAKAEGK